MIQLKNFEKIEVNTREFTDSFDHMYPNYHLLLNPLQLSFWHYRCIETIDKITNDLHIAKSQADFSILISLDKTEKFDTVDHSLLHIPFSLDFQKIVFLKKVYHFSFFSSQSLTSWGTIFGSLLYLQSLDDHGSNHQLYPDNYQIYFYIPI